MNGIDMLVGLWKESHQIERTRTMGMNQIWTDLVKLLPHGPVKTQRIKEFIGRKLMYRNGQRLEIFHSGRRFLWHKRYNRHLELNKVKVADDVVHHIDRTFVTKRRYQIANFYFIHCKVFWIYSRNCILYLNSCS